MLRINSFGGLSVERDGRLLAGAAAQPRRMAILALLTRADDRGVTRDRVMTLLWPDTDEERARRALTQALYALRQDLGDDAAITGVQDLRLDLERVSTDLHEFRMAKSRDSLDDAAAAYRGPFLDGFHLAGAEEFERWADEERRGLAREYAELVERLAFLAEKRGDFSTAVSWWRRLAAVDPLSARVAVSLMRALAAAGDPHAAIQHARVHEALLEQELDLPADREVVALAARLRREARQQSTESQESALNQAVEAEQLEDDVKVREPAGDPALASQSVSSVAATDGSNVSTVQTANRRRKRTWRRSWLISGAIAGAVGLAIVVRLSTSTPALAGGPVVVVGRIADYSGEPNRSPGSPIGDMLATNLARAPGLRVVSSARMYELLGRTASSSRDTTLRVVIAAARLAGATDLIDGAIHRVGEGKLRLDIQRVDVSSGAVIRAYTVVGGDLFALADSGSLRLVRHLGTTLPTGSLADVTTRSAVAYRLYAEGLRAYSTGERERADSLFVAALNEDSTFAMATYYHSTLTRDKIPALARAVALSASASERERLIIRSEWASANSSPSILAYAESLSVRYPAELEGHLHIGRAFVNLGRFMESVPLLQRVVDMDSASLSGRTVVCSACAALSWMLGAYLHADSVTAAERVARRWVAVQGGSPSPWMSLGAVLEIQGRWSEASEAYAVSTRLDRRIDAWETQVSILLRRGELAAVERLAAQHVAGTPFGSAWWTVIARRYAGRHQDAIDEARRGLATVRPNESPSGMLLLLGQALLEGGRYYEAADVFDSFAREPDPRLEFSSFARNRAFVLTHISNALAAAGDTARLAAIADSVQVLGAQSSYGRDRRLFHHVRGLLLRARGDLSAAADEFRAAIWTPTFGYTRSNLELAKTLLTLNRPREAIATLQPALRGSVEASNLYVTLTDLHEQLGRAWEAAGSMDSAAVHFEYVARAWQRGDPPLARRSAEARAKLAALRPRAR